MGSVITFYSFKGGVGRSMAVANVAALLAQWGYKTLIVDWDLEAPGLEKYFTYIVPIPPSQGLGGLLKAIYNDPSYSDETNSDWRQFRQTFRLPTCPVDLSLLGSGRLDDNRYFADLRQIDLRDFYESRQGGHVLENLRDQWLDEYDFVLIDSRTGVTDSAGICTIQMPDVLVLLATTNWQSLEGAVRVGRRARVARKELPIDREALKIVPIASRFDTQQEIPLAQEWIEIFATEFAQFYRDWKARELKDSELVQITKIPYVPYFSFGERIAVVDQGTLDPAGLGYAYEAVSALLANKVENVERLLDDRGTFIRQAAHRSRMTSAKSFVLLLYSHRDKKWKDEFRPHMRALDQVGLSVELEDRQIDGGEK